jgi:hypothetical protein
METRAMSDLGRRAAGQPSTNDAATSVKARPLAYLWRHPRRTGFIAFNAIVLVLLAAWGAFTTDMTREGIAGVPNVMLGYAGMTFLAVTWVVGWIAWLALLVRRSV